MIVINNEIISVKYGESVLPENVVFQGGDKEKVWHIDFILYLIKTADRLILVDAGCETMPGFEMKNFDGTVKALKKTGFDCESITDVIITHAHHDHIECAGYFEKATIHIQEDEYESGKRYLKNNINIKTFKDEQIVCNGVKIIRIGGHSKGSCIVEIENGDECIAIMGDECYSHKCITEKIPTGSSEYIEKSVEFIKKYSSGKYTLLFCHDEKVLRKDYEYESNFS